MKIDSYIQSKSDIVTHIQYYHDGITVFVKVPLIVDNGEIVKLRFSPPIRLNGNKGIGGHGENK